jgi:hypothetical protein
VFKSVIQFTIFSVKQEQECTFLNPSTNYMANESTHEDMPDIEEVFCENLEVKEEEMVQE